jgi:hypothetical protein
MRRLYYNKETLAGDICEARARFLRSWARNTKWKRITDLVRQGRKSTRCLMIAPRPLLSLLILIVSFSRYSYVNLHCIDIGGLA